MAKRKRSPGEGSVRKLKSGNWHGELMDGVDECGKKVVVSFCASTRGEVLDLIRDYKNNRDAHVRLDKKITLSECAARWYKDYESQVQASTYCGYFYTMNIITEHLGSKPIAELLPIDINKFQDALKDEGYCLSSIHKCRTMLVQIFDFAEENGVVLRNSARKSKRLRDVDGSLSEPRRKKDAFNKSELALLEEKLNDDLIGHSIILMLNTGLRVQELIALSPADIAEDGSWVSVGKAVKMVNGVPMLGTTKSKAGIRVVPVPENARNSAVFLRTHGGKKLIWSLPGKNPVYSVGSFRRRYYFAIKQVPGVRALSPHCCRHTYISRLQDAGVPIEIIARLVGHRNVDVTVGYAHPDLDLLQFEVDKLMKKGDL